MIRRQYCLDSPSNGDKVQKIIRCSGWDLQNKNEIGISINGLPSFSFCRSFREDLRSAFPSVERAVNFGFYGDIVLPEKTSNNIKLELVESVGEKWIPFHEINIISREESKIATSSHQRAVLYPPARWSCQNNHKQHRWFDLGYRSRNRGPLPSPAKHCIDGCGSFSKP